MENIELTAKNWVEPFLIAHFNWLFVTITCELGKNTTEEITKK